MISYLILHYNRPYLLDINIKLIRKYFSDIQIVVADDGSDPEVINMISKFAIDDLYVQKRNQNTWKEGSCSTTIKKSRKLCKHDFIVFSEDDFFYCAQPVSEPYDTKENNIMPLIFFPDKVNINIIDEGINLLTNYSNIKNVQLAKDPMRLPVAEKINSKNAEWFFVNHKIKKACYYCNWPSLLRRNDYYSVPIDSGRAIWNFEAVFSKAVDHSFGKGNWAVVPPKRYYVHVGMPFSKRLNTFIYSEKRAKFGRKVQLQAFNKIVNQDIEGFNKFLIQSYLSNKFYIDFDEMLSVGLNEAFLLAFERLAKYV